MPYETFLIGLIAAVLYVEIFDLYPGGIIVPGYIALFLDQPPRILVTLAVAVLSLLTYRILSRYMILFGRRRFVMLILLGALWGQIWFFIAPHVFPEVMGLRVIGWVIPGLLANNLEKQPVLPTLASLFSVSALTFFVVRLLDVFTGVGIGI